MSVEVDVPVESYIPKFGLARRDGSLFIVHGDEELPAMHTTINFTSVLVAKGTKGVGIYPVKFFSEEQQSTITEHQIGRQKEEMLRRTTFQ